MPESDFRFHSAVAALYDPVQAYFERFQAPEHRRYLTESIEGRVLEIGVGTGAMFSYYDGIDAEPVVHGVEPDPGMWRRARGKLEAHETSVELVCGRAEALPYEDETFDYVIECGLLCSVGCVSAALKEIHRVLTPDGEFRFFDHVRSDGVVGRSQDALTPLWRKIGGNCHLNRSIQPALQHCETARIEEIDRLSVGY